MVQFNREQSKCFRHVKTGAVSKVIWVAMQADLCPHNDVKSLAYFLLYLLLGKIFSLRIMDCISLRMDRFTRNIILLDALSSLPVFS